MYLMCHPKQVPFPGSSIHFITSSLELFNQKTSCGCQHPTTFAQIAHQNYIASNLVHLLLQADVFVSYFIEKKNRYFRSGTPSSFYHQIHPQAWSACTLFTFLPTTSVKSPCSYAEPAPTYTLDRILSHLLKDFDSEMIPLRTSLVSRSLQIISNGM